MRLLIFLIKIIHFRKIPLFLAGRDSGVFKSRAILQFFNRIFNAREVHFLTVFWNCIDLLRFRFRLWKFGSGSGSRQYLAQFSNNKIEEKKSRLAYVRSSIISQKVGLSFLIPDPVPLRQKVTVIAVPVQQHFLLKPRL